MLVKYKLTSNSDIKEDNCYGVSLDSSGSLDIGELCVASGCVFFWYIYVNWVHVIVRESEELKQIDSKYIPDTIARKSDIPETAQPDWNQNDEAANDYIKNRPFYDDSRTLEFNEKIKIGSYCASQSPISEELHELLINEQYEGFTIDGNPLTNPVRGNHLSEGEVVFYTVGNTNLIVPMSGASAYYENLAYSDGSYSNSETKSIVGTATVGGIKLIDKKFIPKYSYNDLEAKPFYEEVATVEFDGENLITDADLWAKLFEERENVVFVVDNNEYTYKSGSDYTDDSSQNFQVVNSDNTISYVIYATSENNGIDTFRVMTMGGSLKAATIKLPSIKQLDEKYIPELSFVILKSTTENSTKKFKVTVDDNGTLSATEVTN